MRTIRFHSLKKNAVAFDFNSGDSCVCFYLNGKRVKHLCAGFSRGKNLFPRQNEFYTEKDQTRIRYDIIAPKL